MADESSSGKNAASYYAVLNVPRDASDEDIKKAYRHLAREYHPDKHADPQLQAYARDSFQRIQEAYEVLGNPERRQVYDIYGEEGLRAGLEVGPKLRTGDDLRAEFEAFRAQQAAARAEARIAHRGLYRLKIDASAFVDPYDPDLPRAPEVHSLAMVSSVQLPVSDTLAATAGGQMAVQQDQGSGSFVCGVKRIVTPVDSVTAQLNLGLKSVASLAITRQLTQHAAASLSATWAPGEGMGLAFSTARQLTQHTEGDFSWVVGPAAGAGVSLGMTRRRERLIAAGRVEVGTALGVQGKLVWRLSERTLLKVAAKVANYAAELEVGASQRISEFSTIGLAVVTGRQGVLVRPRFTRGAHVFEFPILLTPVLSRSWRVWVAAYMLPPLLSLSLKYLVVRPAWRWHRKRQLLEARRGRVREVRAALAAASGAAELMRNSARRKLDAELAQDGLVIVDARYGALDAILATEVDAERAAAQLARGAADGPGPPAPGAVTNGPTLGHSASQGADAAAAPGAAAGGEEYEDAEEAGVAAKVEAALAAEGPPPPWVDVTTPVRFMVNDGRAVFNPGPPLLVKEAAVSMGSSGWPAHESLPPGAVPAYCQAMVTWSQGVAKAGLMGFCDAAPGAPKALRMRFRWRGQPYAATFADLEGGELPTCGALLTSPAAIAVLDAEAAAQGLTPCPPAMPPAPAPANVQWDDAQLNPLYASSPRATGE